ncbi:hypothetical protein GB937_003585 [Aspergillus fischeri]|nr:hypothetical protein GB937_003585 [Aspergillus fischeri]
MFAAPSSRPNFCTVASIHASTDVEDPTSTTVVRTVSLSEPSFANALVRALASMSARERRAPRACSCCATARPIPATPVTA